MWTAVTTTCCEPVDSVSSTEDAVTQRHETRPDCAAVREAVSAHLDDEAAPLTRPEVRHHLEGCPSCRGFATALDDVARRTRVAAADPVPDLTDGIVAAVAAARGPEGRRRALDLRLLVAVAGLVQVALALPLFVGLVGPDLHVMRDLGAVQLAIGLGLLLAARDPSRSHGLLPVVAAVVAVSLVGAGVDVAAGRATVVAELPHLTELVGLVALWALSRRVTSFGTPQLQAAT
jgi:predicted anti-sigma-YlaC factor YlaD